MKTAWYKTASTRSGENSGYFDRERSANPQSFSWYNDEPEDDGYPDDDYDGSVPENNVDI